MNEILPQKTVINIKSFWGEISDTEKEYTLGNKGLPIQAYFWPLKEVCSNRVAGGFNPPAPTAPCMRVRTGRFTKITGP